MLLGAALLTESLVPIVIALHFRTVAYLVFRDGLVHVRGSRRTIVRWDEITDVFEKRTYRGTRYRIVLSDGRTTSITPILTNHDELGATIVAKVKERVTPQVLRFCENGGTASFPLAVSADRATSRSTQVAWGSPITRLPLGSTAQMTSVQTTAPWTMAEHGRRAQPAN